MANPVKGEVQFMFGGRRRTFRIGMNQVCSLERALGMSIATVLDAKRVMHLADLREILYHGLLADDPSLTLEDVGDMIEVHPDPSAIGPMIRESMQAAMPHIFQKKPGGASPLAKAPEMIVTPATATPPP